MKTFLAREQDSQNVGRIPTLIERLQRRDPEALGELYDIYGRAIYGLVIRIVRDTGIAEDLVQETFINVWRRAPSFDPQRGAVGPWLKTVARNRALDYVRSSESRKYRLCGKLEQMEDPALFVHPERRALAAYEIGVIFDAMRKLSVNQRAVIDLAYFEGSLRVKSPHAWGAHWAP